MKKLCFLIFCTLFSLTASSIETVDYTQGLSVWFDTPNNLDGQAVWLRASGTGANPDKTWESRSLPIGNGSLGANIMGSISAERITLNEKTLWKGGPNTAKGAEYYWNVNKQSAGVLKKTSTGWELMKKKTRLRSASVLLPRWENFMWKPDSAKST